MLCAHAVQAQSPVFYPSNYPKILGKSTTDTLPNAFTGGITHPIFGNVDINMDGRQDLVILNREISTEGAVLPFLSVRKGNAYVYVYAPQYTHLFPPVKEWGVFGDFNFDGKTDLFLYGTPFGAPGSITAFKNVGSGDSVRFEMHRKEIMKYSRSSTPFSKISANSAEIPTFSDIDGDGDLDMLSFDAFSSSDIHYYKNVSKDSMWSLDSLKFALVDQCWGRMREAGEQDPGGLLLNINCLQHLAIRDERMHSGSTIAAIDMDDDGDKDLLIGDATYPYMTYAKNDRLPVSGSPKKWDTVGSFTRQFPANNPIRIQSNPMASLVDVNADGKVDILASPMDIGTARKDIVWHYENTGSSTKPIFTFRDSAFLEKTMLDEGDFSAPCFLDYNNDGKTDMLLAVSSEENDTHTEQVYYYRNAGPAGKPAFILENKDFLGLKSSLLFSMVPAVGDMNNDGKADLVIGNTNGKLYYFPNQSTSGGFQFPATGTYLQEDENGSTIFIDVLDNSIPAIGDLDGDGKADLLIGSKSGNIVHYRNISTGSTPLFKKVTDNYGSISIGTEAAPCLGFIDGDDTLDLLVGSLKQPVRFYKNVNATGAPHAADSNLFSNFSNTSTGSLALYRSTPALAHLDQDSSLDVALGNSRGGLLVYTTKNNTYTLPTAGFVEAKKPEQLRINLYPNPTDGRLTVSLEDIAAAQPVTVSVTDMLGREVLQSSYSVPTGDSKKAFDMTGFSPGVYTVRITLPRDGKFATRQLMISR